jgi:predicted HAD superfamily Cof-like phosphohydrolase
MSLAARAFQVAYHDTPVREFHEAFGLPVNYDPKLPPSIEQRVLRVQMLASELVELARASGVRLLVDTQEDGDEDAAVRCEPTPIDYYDPVEAADALGDIKYLADGGNVVYGFPGDLVIAEIHRSNMSKLGDDGKPIFREDGKVMKGPKYFKPNIRRVLFGEAPNPEDAVARQL